MNGNLQQRGRVLAPAVFLDRDGVLVANVFYEDSGLWEAPRTSDRCTVHPRTGEALNLLRDAGFELIVISNQPNVALRKSTRSELDATHREMERELREQGVVLTGSYYCFHHPRSEDPSLRNCACRKPSPQMVLDAANDHGIDLGRSWMIGDRSTDIECGQRAGVRTIRVAPNHPVALDESAAGVADDSVQDLLEAVHRILNEQSTRGRLHRVG